MPACTECHIAKVKCDGFPCSRCKRLSKVCELHKSNQGKGRKKKRPYEEKKLETIEVTPVTSVTSSFPEHEQEDIQGVRDEDGCVNILANIAARMSIVSQEHYGLRFLIRKWVATAIRRRSFSLLSKASALAAKCNISMDMVLCGEDSPAAHTGMQSEKKMDYLEHILLTPAKYQQVTGDRLRWSEIPKPLLDATRCSLTENSNASVMNGIKMDPWCKMSEENFFQTNIANRWIIVLDCKKGITRFFVTPAFDRSIASWSALQHVESGNNDIPAPVPFSVFVEPSEMKRLMKGWSHQMSLHPAANMPPIASRVSGIMIKPYNIEGTVTRATPLLMEVDVVCCLHIVNVDHGFMFLECLRRDVTTAENWGAAVKASTTGAVSDPSSMDQWKDFDLLFENGELDMLLDSL